jgi:5'-deoxynucleotidase YfbR-like HD superfamily hydrolase
MGELVTGDVPSPTKDALGSNLHNIDSNVERWLDLKFDLTVEEARYLHAADKFELWLWCWDEHERGNRTFSDWIETTNERWATNPLPPAFETIRWHVEDDRRVGHLSNVEIKAAGGLS